MIVRVETMARARALTSEDSGGCRFVISLPLWSRRLRAGPLALLLLLSAFVLTGVAWQRGAEYDEGYTVFLVSGVPRPDWPATPFYAGDERGVFDGSSTPLRIVHDLRANDVHPPLYFWAAAGWRALFGPDLFVLRLFSVLCGVATLALVAGLAAEVGVPPLVAMLLTLGCYGFSYTEAVTRDFTLAELLTAAGVWMLVVAARRGGMLLALAGGLALGLASFANYLTSFVAAASLLWLLVRAWRRPSVWLPAGIGFAALLPADLFFFLAQRGSRDGQFPPFHLLPSIARLAQYTAANVFGGLPLYAGGALRWALGGGLALALVGLVLLIAARWRQVGQPDTRRLLALAAVAPPVGLIALGMVFDNTPIELRYIAYATPFFAMLLAGAFASLPPARGAALLVLVLALQAASLVGLARMPQTMQPQAAATHLAAALAGPDGLVLIPRGNDGVGVVGAVIQSAPDWLRLLVVPRDAPAEAIRARVGAAPKVVLALIAVDDDSRATLPQMEALFRDHPCWRETVREPLAVAFARTAACAPTAGVQ